MIKIKIICDCGSSNVSIMSVREGVERCDKKVISTVDIIYICNDCGNTENKSEYLYKLKNAKLKEEHYGIGYSDNGNIESMRPKY